MSSARNEEANNIHQEFRAEDLKGLLQRNTFDQYDSAFKPSIKIHKSPTSICGPMTIANIIIINEFLNENFMKGEKEELTHELLDELCARLRNKSYVYPEVISVLAWLKESRESYILEHVSDFKDEHERNLYCSAWTANYEISDFFQEHLEGKTQRVFFSRYNQWPEHLVATYEEAVRLKEEERFSARFLMEEFHPRRRLLPATEWQKQNSLYTSLARIFAVDIDGHFVTALDCVVGGESILVVFNSMKNIVLEKEMISHLRKLTYRHFA